MLIFLIRPKLNYYKPIYTVYHIDVNHTWPPKVIRFLLPHLILFGWNLSWDFEIINSHTVGCQRLTHFSSFEYTQNVSIFDEQLYSQAWLAWPEPTLLCCSGFQACLPLNRFLNPWPVPFIVEFVESQFWMWEYG